MPVIVGTPDTESYSTADQRIRNRVINECPEFLCAYDFLRNPWSVEDLLFINGPYFKPFKGAKVLDFGANVGILTAYWAANGAEVTSYEADPRTYYMLMGMLAHTGLKVNAINSAIWTHNGTVTFKGSEHQDNVRVCRTGAIQDSVYGAQICLQCDYSKLDSIIVPCVTLTEALGNIVWDFVKIDIEGAEYEVLAGTTSEVLHNHIKCMNLELHESNASILYPEIKKKLGSLGNSSC
jgi:FkbM family methyltransferase